MERIPLHTKVAILIDADNAQLDYIEQVLTISEYYGKLETCRIYGDWNKSPLSSWCETLDSLKNVERIPVERVGKNATDNRLLIEVGEILEAAYWENNIHAFVIVSGDGDFTAACKRIQERGKYVIGIGNKMRTSTTFLDSCDKSYYLEDLDNELAILEKRHPIPPREVRELFNVLFFAYHKTTKTDWMSFGQLGKRLREEDPNFERKYGKYKLSNWLTIFDEDFEIRDQMIRRKEPRLRFGFF